MRLQIKVSGIKGIDEVVETVIEKDMIVGSGVRFNIDNTRYFIMGRVAEIDELHQSVRIESEHFNGWIGFYSIREVFTPEELSRSMYQTMIDTSPQKDG